MRGYLSGNRTNHCVQLDKTGDHRARLVLGQEVILIRMGSSASIGVSLCMGSAHGKPSSSIDSKVPVHRRFLKFITELDFERLLQSRIRIQRFHGLA